MHNRLATATAWKELFTVPSQFLVFWSKYVWSLLKGLVTLTKTLISRVCFAFCNVCHNLKGMHVGSQKVWESTHTASYRIFRQEFCGFQPVWKNKTSLVFSSYAQPDFNILKLNPYFNIPGSDSHFISVHDLRSVDRKNSNFHLHLIYFISTNPSVDRKNSNFYSYFTYSINTNRIYLRRSNYLQPAPTMHPWERWASRTRKLLRIITGIKQFSEEKATLNLVYSIMMYQNNLKHPKVTNHKYLASKTLWSPILRLWLQAPTSKTLSLPIIITWNKD